MHEHDRIFLPYTDAKPLIQEADILLFRGKAWYSFLIEKMTQSEYSHVGLASWHNGDGKILEVLEFHGGRGGGVAVDFDNYIKSQSHQIDVFRPIPKYYRTIFNSETHQFIVVDINLLPKDITQTMRRLTGIPYGWKRIWWFTKFYLPGLRFFYNLQNLTSDEQGPIIYPVCSTSVAYSFTKNCYDLIRNRSDEWTRPGDIAESPLLDYMFTLT